MNKKSALRIIIAVILVCMLCATACTNNKDKGVSKIQIVSGSFKEKYNLDEQIAYDRIYIIATYSDGKTKQIKAEQSWISGLDVTTTGAQKSLTVTFGGATASFFYSVNYKNSVTTSVRLIPTWQDENGQKAITLALKGLDKMSVYAVRIDITLYGMTLVGKDDALVEGWTVVTSTKKDKLSLLFYSKDGNTLLDEQGGLATLYLSGKAESIYLETTISDGISDHRAPDLSLNIK